MIVEEQVYRQVSETTWMPRAGYSMRFSSFSDPFSFGSGHPDSGNPDSGNPDSDDPYSGDPDSRDLYSGDSVSG